MIAPIAILQLATDALLELGAIRADQTPPINDLQFVVRTMNRILDNWNAERAGVYVDQFETFTLVPALQPHTIGPTGVWVTDQRPVSIEDLALGIPSSGPTALVPINLRDVDWWAGIAVPDLTSSIPTDAYYAPTWPNGSLYFWPVPTTAYDVTVQTRIVLASVALTDTISLPPGYQDALLLTTAEALTGPLRMTAAPDLSRRASKARARIFANNAITEPMDTRDAGMPGNDAQESFNYLSRTWSR